MAVNKKFDKALKKGADLIEKLIKDHLEGLEKSWVNREEDEALVIDFKVKLLPKDKDNIKVESHIAYNPEKKVKDHSETVITDQTKLNM